MGCEISTGGDIYSFGVILLEMLTGKHPTDDMFTNGLTLHNFVESGLSKDMSEIIDSSLLPHNKVEEASHDKYIENQEPAETQSCITQLAKLGIKCSVESPKDRPCIKDVCSQIISIKEAMPVLLSCDSVG
jgi:serine/threonine protein kinase